MPERAAQRAGQLAAIDPDWNPGTLGLTVDWQRHYAGVRTLLAAVADSGLDLLERAVSGGRWLHNQTRAWGRLNAEHQRRLAALGVKPPQRPTAATGGGKSTTVGGCSPLPTYRPRKTATSLISITNSLR